MAQDIRKMFEQARENTSPQLPEGHEDRFLQKLEAQLPQKKKRRLSLVWLQTAAASLLLIIMGWGGYQVWKSSPAKVVDGTAIVESDPKTNISPSTSAEKPLLTLSNISPDLKKVETYFISSINVALANLDVTEDEQEMVDAYLVKVRELGKEYDNLNQELNTIGVNDMTITALIENLKMRLQLLQRLKKNLNHSKKETHEKKSSGNI